MPNRVRFDSVFLGTQGNPDQLNIPINTIGTTGVIAPGTYYPYAPGEVGGSFEVADKVYTMVYLDSGCTAATPTGSLLANHVLFWKEKAAKIVTNDQRFAMAANGLPANAYRNFPAGLARLNIPVPGALGNQIAMLVKGYNVLAASDGTGGAGQMAIVSGTAGTAQVTPVAVGTAPAYLPLGVMRAAPSAANLVYIDLNLETIP